MRRRDRAPGAVPEQLCRFVRSEWSGDDPVREWKAACLAWLAADPRRRLPFGEHGDPLDVLKEAYRLIREGVNDDR